MQWRVATWILGTFSTFPLLGIEAIVGLILIHLHLQKLGGQFQLRTQLLYSNHIIKLIMEFRYSDNSFHWLSLEHLTPKQQLNVKGSIMDTNNRLNSVFSSFIPFSSEFLPGYRLIDILPSNFLFYLIDRKNKESIKVYNHKLNELIL